MQGGGAHPGDVQGRLRWSALERQGSEKEKAALEVDGYLSWKPRFLDWCALDSLPEAKCEELSTRIQSGEFEVLSQLPEGSYECNPVTGRVQARYYVCAMKNSDGQCIGYDPQTRNRVNGRA